MEKKTIEQGKIYIEDQVRKGVSEKGNKVRSIEWKAMPNGEFEVEMRSRDGIADKRFTKNELELYEVDNQFRERVEAKILSLVLNLK